MTISELIEVLKSLQELHGNLPVAVETEDIGVESIDWLEWDCIDGQIVLNARVTARPTARNARRSHG